MSDIITCETGIFDKIDGHLHNLYNFLHHVAWLQANADEDQTIANSALDLLKVARDKIEADLDALTDVCEIVYRQRGWDRDFPDRVGETISVEIVRVKQPAAKTRPLQVAN